MKTIYKYLFCLIFTLVGCNKEALIYETEPVKGKVWIEDRFMENPKKVVSGGTVYLANNAAAETYLFKTDVAKDGSFTISHQPTKKEGIYLVAKFDTLGISYQGSFDLNALPKDGDGTTSLVLNPQYPLGILKVMLLGPTPSNQPVKDAEIFLFENEAQALSIKDPGLNGVVRQSTTNSKGVTFFYNLLKGNFFVVGRLKTSKDTLYTNQVQVAVDDALNQKDKKPSDITTLTLRPNIPNARLAVTVRDASNLLSNPLKGVDVYLFSSLSQAKSIYDPDDPKTAYYVDKKTTNEKGQSTFEGLEAMTYFVGVRGNLSASVPLRYLRPLSITLTSGAKATLVVNAR
ncbi:MAG: hypothetical protein ABIN80_13785 [Dyadobacter sp.]|uniref:hypothetical protein n=1 Tax=Dyadobacter sp. TaxID=1914288 RepID=UPI00326601F0